MLHDLPDAPHIGGTRSGVGVDNAEPEIRLQESMHHHPIPELKDLQREDGPGEQNQGKRKERELDDVIRLGGAGVVLLGE